MSTQHTVYPTKLVNHLTKWIKRKSRKLPDEWLFAALMLLRACFNIDLSGHFQSFGVTLRAKTIEFVAHLTRKSTFRQANLEFSNRL